MTTKQNFRDKFAGFTLPDEKEFDALWNDCFFALDANVLLHIFRYDKKVVEQLFSLLEAFSERLWVPYQSGLEFYRNWRRVDANARAAYQGVIEEVEKDGLSIRSRFQNLSRYDLFDTSEIFESLSNFLKDTNARLAKSQGEHLSKEGALDNLSKLQSIIGDNVGDEATNDVLAAIFKEGAIRYARKIPPGFKDDKKSEPDKYGDLVIWKDIIAHSKLTKKPVIFVTDDRKDDWWEEAEGQKIGPRPELLQEFLRETDARFYMYNFGQFIERASRYLGRSVDKDVLADIERSEQARQKSDDKVAERIAKNQIPQPALQSEAMRLQEQRNKLMMMYNDSYGSLNRVAQQLNDVQQLIIQQPGSKNFLASAEVSLQRNLEIIQVSLSTIASDIEVNARQLERASILGL